jgi:hypothetical protein
MTAGEKDGVTNGDTGAVMGNREASASDVFAARCTVSAVGH